MQFLPPSPYPVGNNPVGLTIDSTGVYALVANDFDNTLSAFTIGGDGSLTSLNQIETGAAPQFPAFANSAAVATSTPSGVLAANINAGTMSAFTIDSTGVLASIEGSPYPRHRGQRICRQQCLRKPGLYQ